MGVPKHAINKPSPLIESHGLMFLSDNVLLGIQSKYVGTANLLLARCLLIAWSDGIWGFLYSVAWHRSFRLCHCQNVLVQFHMDSYFLSSLNQEHGKIAWYFCNMGRLQVVVRLGLSALVYLMDQIHSWTKKGNKYILQRVTYSAAKNKKKVWHTDKKYDIKIY